MTRLMLSTLLVASLGATACTNDPDEVAPPDVTPPPPGATAGSPEATYDHDNNTFDPWALIDRLAKEGPARFSSQVHGCAKVRYRTFGNVLTSLGVNTADQAQLSPGQLYRDGANAMGAPNFANRIRENISATTSGSARAFDIFAAAAPAIIAALPGLQRCQVGGVPAVLFDGTACRPDGITCLIGMPAQTAHVEFCTLAVRNASTPAVGQQIAVAALLAAAYSCE
jgi:hypothetical protein